MRTARVRSDLYSAMSAQPPLPSKGQPLQGIFYLHPRSPLIGGKAVFNYAVCYSAKGGQNSKRYPLRDGYVRLAIKAVGLFLLAARHSKQACSALAPQRRFPSGSCSHPQASGFPASHRSPGSPLPCRLQSRCSHPQHQPDGAAGLTRSKCVGFLPLFDRLCKRRSHRCTPLEPHSVRRLPRPTALPAHILRDSVRFAPRDSQDVEPAHTDARPECVPNFTGITRAEGSSGI